MRAVSKKLKQLVPQEICLACRGCCRFIEAKSIWVPQIADAEIQEAVAGGIPAAPFSKGDKKDRHLATVEQDGFNYCDFIEIATNRCEMYPHRPFDCQLYPFILMRRDREVFVAVHMNCPFIKEHFSEKGSQEYLRYLEDFFAQPGVKRFVQENDFLVQKYAGFEQEIKLLFPLS